MKMATEYDPRIGIVGGALEHLERIEEYGVARVELVMQQTHTEPQIREAIRRNGWTVSVHCPLFRETDFPEYPLLAALFDTDCERQELALRLMEHEVTRAPEWDAIHVVVHLQRSVGVFHETVPPGWTPERALDSAVRAGERLARVAEQAGITLHVENMMSHPLFADAESYLGFLDRLPAERVLMCLDVGHLAMDARYYGFDLLGFVRALAPRIGSLHLHNNQIEDDFDFAWVRERRLQRKFPVHPSQSESDLWIDVESILRELLAVNPLALPTLEVYYHLDEDREHFREGLRWLSGVYEECAPLRRE